MRSRLAAALLVLFALTAAACGDDDGADVTASPSASGSSSGSGSGSSSVASDAPPVDEDAELVIYSGRTQELVEPLIQDFEAATGVDASVRYGASAELGAALLEEGDRTPADVFFSQEVGAIGVLDQAGLLAPLPADLIGRVADRFRPGSGEHWVGVTGRSRVIVYNPDVIDEVPTSVMDLTDPAYEGQVAWAPANASFQGFITAFRVTQGDDAARSWLEAMKDNGTEVYENNEAILNAVEAGDIGVGLINHYYWARLRAERGEELRSKLVFPKGDDPGGLVNATGVGILEPSASNPAALEFVEYLLSDEGQTYFRTETFEYPAVDSVEDPEGLPALEELEGPAIDLSDLESLEATQELLLEVGLLS